MLTHEEKRKYNCVMCSHTDNSMYNLVRHYGTMHRISKDSDAIRDLVVERVAYEAAEILCQMRGEHVPVRSPDEILAAHCLIHLCDHVLTPASHTPDEVMAAMTLLQLRHSTCP